MIYKGHGQRGLSGDLPRTEGNADSHPWCENLLQLMLHVSIYRQLKKNLKFHPLNLSFYVRIKTVLAAFLAMVFRNLFP